MTERPWIAQALWILAAGVVGLAVSGVFGGILHVSRQVFILPDLLVVGFFTYAFLAYNRISPISMLRHHWRRGLAWAVVFAAVSLYKVLTAVPSAPETGWLLVWDSVWTGVVYSTLDALLLSVVPVLAVSRAFKDLGWQGRRVALWISALVASAFITVLFHVGFGEFHAYAIWGAVLGNGILTLGFLVSGSALTPILAHIVVHGAALLHGPATVSVMPPH